MTSFTLNFGILSLAVSVVGYSQENNEASSLNDASVALTTSAWTPEDAVSVEQQWGERLRDRSLVAACFLKFSDDFIAPSLTIRKERLEDNRIMLKGPSFHHESHILGQILGVAAPGEGVQRLQIKDGKMVEVSGPDDVPELIVEAITLVSTLDDTAHKEFRESVVIEGGQDDQDWIYEFPNCRVFQVNPAHD